MAGFQMIISSSIATALSNNDLWQYLTQHPNIAEKVKSLEIADDGEWWDKQGSEDESEEGYCSITDSLTEYRDELEMSEKLLLEALSQMTSLESLVWERSVPLINQGEEIPGHPDGSIYQEDIWTILRDITPLKNLKVIDWSRTRRLRNFPRPIFESTIFTLQNLTDIDLRIIYSPFNPKEGMHIDDRDDFDLIPGRVHIERLGDLLRKCPNLEGLALEINDQDFYDLGGNPYTDITPIIASNFWPYLKILKLQDVLIDRHKMGDFLFHHRALQNLSATFSLPRDDHLPAVSFDLPNFTTPLSDFLPNLERLYVRPDTLRRVLHYVRRPSPLQKLGVFEPSDWNADEELEENENYVHCLDDVWGDLEQDGDQPEPRTPESPRGSPHPEPPVLKNYLVGIRNLRSIVVKGITRFMQLSRLIRATLHLESVVFLGDFIDELYDHPTPHREVLPYLSRWTNLEKVKGCIMWPRNQEFEISSQDALDIAKDIVKACPNLRLVSYDGHTIQIIQDEDGEVKLEWEEQDGEADMWW